MDLFLLIGYIGALVMLVGFFLNQIGKWQTDDFEYDFINLIGAAILSIYAWYMEIWPIFVLFVIWGIFSLKDIVLDIYKNLKSKEARKSEPVITQENKTDEEL